MLQFGDMHDDWQEQFSVSTQTKRRGFGAAAEQGRSLDVRMRVRIIWSFFVVLIAFVSARIAYLQIIDRGQQSLTSRVNHIELKRELSARGIVYDRRGEALVINQQEESRIVRQYPLGSAIAPILGYLSEVRGREIGCHDGLCYQSGMLIGRAGVEQAFESTLRGHDGGRLIEVDSRGAEVRELGSNAAESGQDIRLAIDAKLQQAMYSALGGKHGSAVALDMQGKVLGLVTSPSYDPNHIQDYLQDTTELYFLNRALSGMYPPGSVFKIVTSYAGLGEDKITPTTEVEDTGEIKIGPYRYGNWYFDEYGRKEGMVNLARALARSNDIYFYKVGEELGVDNIVKWARLFGLGSKTGIEVSGEKAGFVPDRLWKERATGEKWFLGDTYHIAIGQGDLTVTPLQVARMTVAGVTGRVCQVSLLLDSPVSCRDLGLASDDITAVREGMQGACATGGTAFPFFGFQPPVLCKTGTAQHSGQLSDSDQAHAWITVAYPGENPSMVLTVMLEAAGEGSYEAGPVAKSIIEKWRDLGN